MKQTFLKFIYHRLRSMARKVILCHTPIIIAITGSVGKTSTKEAVAQVMSDAFPNQVRATAGNLNAEIGIPLTILGYTETPSKFALPLLLIPAWFRTFASKYPKYLILEMGVDKPGDMDYFGTIVRPDIGIITSATPAHTANFKDVPEMQAEKAKMAKIIKENGLLIVNDDDEYISKQKFENVETYSLKNHKANASAENIELSNDGMKFCINGGNDKIEVKSQLLGEHLIYADLAAFLTGKNFNIADEKIALSLEKRKPMKGRMNLLKGKNDVLIIDDTYNANPSSVIAALNTLKDIEYSDGRKVAILGNMNELGNHEEEGHKKVAKHAEGKVDLAVFAGPNAKKMADEFGDSKKVMFFSDRRGLEKKLSDIIQPHDLVLVKASQNNNYFEEIVKLLLSDELKPDKVLVRQEKHWRRKKN